MSQSGKGSGLSDARSVTASLQRSRNVLYKALHGSEMAVNQLSVDGELISDALNEHQFELKSSLKSTQSRLRTVQSYEFWEKYSLTGIYSMIPGSLLIPQFSHINRILDLLLCRGFLYSRQEIAIILSDLCSN
jgi:hypothetical protein